MAVDEARPPSSQAVVVDLICMAGVFFGSDEAPDDKLCYHHVTWRQASIYSAMPLA